MSLSRLKPQTEYMRLERVEIEADVRYPDVIQEIVSSARSGTDVVAAIDSTIKALGFDTFMYGCTATSRPHSESKIWTFTTLPVEWVREYEATAYIEVDPRIQGLFRSPLPVLWDQSERGRNRRLDTFLERASRFGIRSGIALLIPDNDDFNCLICFNSAAPYADSIRRRHWIRQQGELMSFGLYFHSLFMKPLIRKGLAPSSQGTPLSQRELETLSFVIQGLTHEQIAERMKITPRTVQAHADSIRSKLNASTIGEAVYLATKAGLLARNTPRAART
jgi:DNA-binding CsgD family transcriptional regulator